METFLKGLLVIYSGLALVGVTLIWANLGAADSARNIGILVASIIPVIIASSGSVKNETLSNTFSFLLMFDNKKGQLTTGNPINPYSSRYLRMLVNVDKVPDLLVSKDPFKEYLGEGRKGLNLIEYGVLSSLQERFHQTWDVALIKRSDANGTSTSWGVGQSGIPGTPVKLSQLRQMISDNPAATILDGFFSDTLWLPPKSQLEISNPAKNLRLIRIHSAKFETKITLAAAGGGIQQQGVWGILDPDPKEMNRYHGFSFPVAVETNISWRVLSSRERALYRKWHENVASILEQYDWALLANDGKEAMNRRVAIKVLGLPDHLGNFIKGSAHKK